MPFFLTTFNLTREEFWSLSFLEYLNFRAFLQRKPEVDDG